MAILDPLVTKFSRWRIPRAVSVLLVYLLLVGILTGAIAGIIPALIEQTTGFATNLPFYFQHLGLSNLVSDQLVSQLLAQVGSLPGQIVKLGVSIVSNIVGVLTVLIFAFYFLVYRSKLDEQMGFFFGEERKVKLGKMIDAVEKRLGSWARGELILMLAIGTFLFLGLTIIGIPYALPLGILAGILEVIPTVGSILGAIPAIFLGFTISPIMGLATTALIFLMHQLENYVLYPKVMEKSVGVNPIITLIALAIGFRLMGVVGALISVPVVLTLQTVSKDYLDSK